MDKFSQLSYSRYDVQKMASVMLTAVEQLNNAKSFAQMEGIIFAVEEEDNHFNTAYSLAHIRHDINTADTFYEGEVRYYNEEVAKLTPVSRAYYQALLASPYRAEFSAKYGELFYKNLEVSNSMLCDDNIPDLIEQGNLTMQYAKAVASASTTFNEEQVGFYGLLKFMQHPKRDTRKAAYEAWAALYESVAPEIEGIYDKLVHLRARMASRLGYNNYTDVCYLQMGRYDYTQSSVASFRNQVKKVVTPLCGELAKAQAKRIGVDKLKKYDESLIFAEGNVDPEGSAEQIVSNTQALYRQLSPQTGEFFDFLTKYELYDLVTKPNKHMGGYCTSLPDYKAPFIFSNFNGTLDDMQVLTHEAGHCFNAYLAMRTHKLSSYTFSTSEINEIHSMSMETFTYPYWAQTFYNGDEGKAEKARFAHLTESLFTLPYMCVVDEYQHKVYAAPQMDAMQRRACWREIEKEYMPWRDYDGNEFLEGGGFWMQKQHIFLYPFYYIDYALARMGAYEFYGRSKGNFDEAWEDYVKLCRAGGSKGYFELLNYAHLANPFEDGAVERAINYIKEELFKF